MSQSDSVKSQCIQLDNTAPHGDQIESLWDCNCGRLGFRAQHIPLYDVDTGQQLVTSLPPPPNPPSNPTLNTPNIDWPLWSRVPWWGQGWAPCASGVGTECLCGPESSWTLPSSRANPSLPLPSAISRPESQHLCHSQRSAKTITITDARTKGHSS